MLAQHGGWNTVSYCRWARVAWPLCVASSAVEPVKPTEDQSQVCSCAAWGLPWGAGAVPPSLPSELSHSRGRSGPGMRRSWSLERSNPERAAPTPASAPLLDGARPQRRLGREEGGAPSCSRGSGRMGPGRGRGDFRQSDAGQNSTQQGRRTQGVHGHLLH